MSNVSSLCTFASFALTSFSSFSNVSRWVNLQQVHVQCNDKKRDSVTGSNAWCSFQGFGSNKKNMDTKKIYASHCFHVPPLETNPLREIESCQGKVNHLCTLWHGINNIRFAFSSSTGIYSGTSIIQYLDHPDTHKLNYIALLLYACIECVASNTEGGGVAVAVVSF